MLSTLKDRFAYAFQTATEPMGIINRTIQLAAVSIILASGLRACNDSSKAQPKIEPGTKFERVGNSNVYREIPKDRPPIKDFDAKR